MKLFTYAQKEDLEKLSGCFPCSKPLYAVGGCVRDALRGRPFYDIDLAGTLTPEELKVALKDSGYSVFDASPRLGTMIIKGKYSYEYTTFRTDSYPAGSGEHTPTQVQFTDDLYLDACRRDFKCNAIYYDISKDLIIDPLNGAEDIKNGILSTTVSPETVLSQDGLRIMRLIRFVSALGYGVESNTLLCAKKLSYLLKDISAERIRDELDRILCGKYCYKALNLMKGIGALETLLPELAENDGSPQNPKYHKYDVLEHIFKVVENCPEEVRLAGLFHDVAKARCLKEDGNTYRHSEVGARMAEKIMLRLKYPNRQIAQVRRLVEAHMFDINGNSRESTYRRFIARNNDILPQLLSLFDADSIGTGYHEQSETARKVRQIYAEMKNLSVPMSVAELAVDGKDMQDIGYRGKAVGEILNELLDMTLTQNVVNERNTLMKIAQRRLQSKDREI